MISRLGSGASPPSAPHSGGAGQEKRVHLGPSLAKPSRVFTHWLRPAAWPVLLHTWRGLP
jgi:hypothetical protein